MRDKNNHILMDGVDVGWEDTRRVVQAEPDDIECVGEFVVTLTANGAAIEAVRKALIAAELLKKAAELGELQCPHSDSSLRAVGLDSCGDVVLQIFRGEKKCDAVGARNLAHLDPARYSGDAVAEKSVRWMADVAGAITQYRNMLASGTSRSELKAQWDHVWEAANGRKAIK
jgi:hypothetical protein